MRSGRWLVRVVAVSAFLATFLPAAPAPATDSRLRDSRREIAATRRRLASAVRSDQEILGALREITGRLDAQRSLLRAAQLRLTRLDIAIAAEERRLARIDRTMVARREIIDARIRQLYILGPVSELEALSGAATIDEFLGRADAMGYVAGFDRRVLQDMAALRYEASDARAALTARRAEQAGVRDEIADRVGIVAGYADVQRDAHGRLQGLISDLRAELAAEQREQARILGLIRARGSVYTGGDGRLGFAWPIRGRITSPYGPRWGGFHTGIDIDCRTGDPIGASKAGRVIASEWGGGYGRMIIIDHGNGYTTLYAHLSQRYVGEGADVGQHQKIGACGASGHATGDHLHFEIRINGNHVNPMRYLP